MAAPRLCRSARPRHLELHHLNDAGFLARLAELGRGASQPQTIRPTSSPGQPGSWQRAGKRPALHHRLLLKQLDLSLSGRDRSPDGTDAAGIGEVNLRIAAVPGLVVHPAPGQLGDHDVAHDETRRAFRSSGARTGERIRSSARLRTARRPDRPRVTGRPPAKANTSRPASAVR